MKNSREINRLKCLFMSWKAICLHAFGNEEKAIFEFERCLGIDPKNGPNLRTLGTILINTGSYLEGAEKLIEALKYLPPSDRSVPDAYAYAGYAYSKLDRLDEAISFYRKAISSWVKDGDFKKVDLIYNLGRIYLQKRSYLEAAEVFESGIELENKEARMHFGLGIACFELGQEGDCLRHLGIAVELAPTLKEDETMKHIYRLLGHQISVH